MRIRPWLAGSLARAPGRRRLVGARAAWPEARSCGSPRRNSTCRGATGMSAARTERGRETPLSLRIQPGSPLEPWLRVALHERPESPVEEVLVLGNPDAVVAYHAASRVGAFADAPAAQSVGPDHSRRGEEPRVGLLIGAEELAPARVPLPELEARDAARLLALPRRWAPGICSGTGASRAAPMAGRSCRPSSPACRATSTSWSAARWRASCPSRWPPSSRRSPASARRATGICSRSRPGFPSSPQRSPSWPRGSRRSA